MKALRLDGISRRAWLMLVALLAVFLVAPLIVNDYLLTVLILIFYFAYTMTIGLIGIYLLNMLGLMVSESEITALRLSCGAM